LTVASKVKQTIAGLQDAESTLRIYSIQSQDKNVKASYREAVKDINEIIKDLEGRLKTLEYEEPQYKSN
jgi:hypothetical protein